MKRTRLAEPPVRWILAADGGIYRIYTTWDDAMAGWERWGRYAGARLVHHRRGLEPVIVTAQANWHLLYMRK